MQRMFKFMTYLAVAIVGTAFACTGITIKTAKNELIQARTVEYGDGYLNSELVITPRGQHFQSLTPAGKTGLKWTNKYGYVGISMMYPMFIGEGMNEKGLSAGIFYFPHSGSLANFNAKTADNSLSDIEFVKWALGNFSTVDEVKAALKQVQIVSLEMPTGHWRIADKQGNNVVLEIVDGGKVHFYDNKVGVLTNAPDYPWHIKNLNNYINLYAGNATNYQDNGEQIFSFGAGTGMLGLPGDITPPSRFVRAFFYLKTLRTPADAQSATLNAFHILNNFDIPIGLEYSAANKDRIAKGLLSATQWTSVSDLSNGLFYYKTMYQSKINKVDLNAINFATVKPQNIAFDTKETFNNIQVQ